MQNLHLQIVVDDHSRSARFPSLSRSPRSFATRGGARAHFPNGNWLIEPTITAHSRGQSSLLRVFRGARFSSQGWKMSSPKNACVGGYGHSWWVRFILSELFLVSKLSKADTTHSHKPYAESSGSVLSVLKHRAEPSVLDLIKHELWVYWRSSKRSEVNLLIIALTFRFGVNLGKKRCNDTIDSCVFSSRIITEFFKHNLFAMTDVAQNKINWSTTNLTRPGACFSKVPVTFPARNPKFKSKSEKYKR